MILPAWVTTEYHGVEAKSSSSIIDKNFLQVLTLLNKIKRSPDKRLVPFSAHYALVLLFCLTVLISLTSNFTLLFSLLAGVLIILTILPKLVIKRTLTVALVAAVFSFLLLLPSLFLGQAKAFLLIPLKSFLTTALSVILISVYPWNEITRSLRTLRVPLLLIQILDLTLQYIFLLGRVAKYRLMALKVRTIGKGTEKALPNSLAGVFFRAKDMSDEMYQAMLCRCG